MKPTLSGMVLVCLVAFVIQGCPNESQPGPVCGNGKVETGEICDGNCPASCSDGNACTSDTLTGSSATCNGVCTYSPVVSCADGDGCCPAACNSSTDSDCSPSCGNGVVEANETCDGNCPADCNDGNACTTDTETGSAQNCSADCSHQVVVGCADGDGCCPAACNSNNDSDCSPTCGNDVVEANETCDGNCPTSCNDGNPCTIDSFTGSAQNCNASCNYQPISVCLGGDGCCPAGCNSKNDSECSPSCGNGVLEVGETCDNDCPETCDDSIACTIDAMTGSAENCNVACSHQPISECAEGDGCCPAGCNARTDADCSPSCGNMVIEDGESCDGNCPFDCSDSNACTIDVLTGSAQNCNAVCSYLQVTECADGDGCCPAGCNASLDSDCSTVCGNGEVDPGEDCDGSNLDGKTCLDLGYTGGDLACKSNCLFHASGCTGCTDDTMEENDTFAGAKDLPAGDYQLTFCNQEGGEEDWFSIKMQAGEVLALILDNDASLLDLSLEVADDDGNTLVYSSIDGDRQELVYTCPYDRTILIRLTTLYPGGRGVVRYRLRSIENPGCTRHTECPLGQVCQDFACAEFSCATQGPCPGSLICHEGQCVECMSNLDCPSPSDFLCTDYRCVLDCVEDEFEPNSQAFNAAMIQLPFLNAALTLCGLNDTDWFSLTLAESHLYDFQADFIQIDGDVDLYFFDDSFNYLAWSISVDNSERITYPLFAGEGGTYYLAVSLYSSPVDYRQTYRLAANDLGAIECTTNAECSADQLCVAYQCVDPLPGDRCTNPIEVSSFPFNHSAADITAYRGDVQFASASCTGYYTDANDVIYRVNIPAGTKLALSLNSDFDAALYVTNSCNQGILPEGACMAGVDATWSPGLETLEFEPASPGIYYVVVDTFTYGNTISGGFSLQMSLL